MANNDRRDRRDDRDDDDRSDRPQPWDLIRIVTVDKVRNGRTEKADEFIRFGVAWPMKESEGFTFDVHFAIPEGSKLAIMKRKPKNGGDRR